MVSKKLALTGILSSGDKLFDSSIKVASVLQGELQDLLQKATLMEDKQKLGQSASEIDELISQLGSKRTSLGTMTKSIEDDFENTDLLNFTELEKECQVIIENLPNFDKHNELLITFGNATDEVAMLKQHIVTITQILTAVTELLRLFRYVTKNV